MNKLTIIFILLFAFFLIGGLAYSLQNNRTEKSPALTTNTQKDSKSTAQSPAANSTTDASLKITK
jgi:preprotein translocase subunit SecG